MGDAVLSLNHPLSFRAFSEDCEMSHRNYLLGTAIAVALAIHLPAQASVSSSDAQKLKSTLMPLGGEKAGNAAGTTRNRDRTRTPW